MRGLTSPPRYSSILQSDGERNGVGLAVRNADLDFPDSFFRGDLRGAAVEPDHGFAADFMSDLDIGPGDSGDPTGPDRLEDRLLGRPATREMLVRTLTVRTITDLRFGENPMDEMFFVTLNHPINAFAFDDVRADADDGHAGLIAPGNDAAKMILP